jgi:hypothetical protein
LSVLYIVLFFYKTLTLSEGYCYGEGEI